MDKSAQHLVLEYARMHEAAFDFKAISPFEYLDQGCTLASTCTSSLPENLCSFDNYINSLRTSIEQDLRTEKLHVSKKDGCFLSTVIQEARLENINIDRNWNSLLPPLNRLGNLKVEPPLVHSDRELDLLSLKQRSVLSLDAIKSSFVQKAFLHLHKRGFQDGSQQIVNEVVEDLKGERLKCTKESLKLIQNARKSGDLSIHGKRGIERFLTHEKTRLHELLSPTLLPLSFDEERPESRVKDTKQMLPSPSSSDTSKIPQSRRDIRKANPPPLTFLRDPSVTERIWLLGSSDIEDLEPSSSQPEEASPAHFDGEDAVGIEQPVVAEDNLADEKKCIGEEGYAAEGMMNTAHDTATELRTSQRLVQIARAAMEEGEELGSHGISSLEDCSRCRQSSMDLLPTQCLDINDPFDEEKETLHNQEADVPTIDIGYPVDEERAYITENSSLDPRDGSTSIRKLTSETETTNTASASTGSTTKGRQSKQRLEVVIDNRSIKAKLTPGSPNSANGKSSQTKKRKSSDNADLGKRLKSGKKSSKQEKKATGRDTQESVIPSPFTTLGSLDSFIETRGVAPKIKRLGKSSYFSASKPGEDVDELGSSKNAVKTSPKQETPDCEFNKEISGTSTQQIPDCPPTSQEPPILFLSTSLLKTHVQVIEFLEAKDEKPLLIYRDYDSGYGAQETKVQNPRVSNGQWTEVEADIIISPTTGILLTNAQAITQLYLPGHKPNPKVSGIAGINSPLRESIFRLAARYEQVYILICNKKRLTSKNFGSTADKRTIEALTSLTAFCNSISAYSIITPLLLSSPKVIGEWVLSLANKHALQMPSTANQEHQRNHFTPVNKPSLRTLLDVDWIETDSNWEVFLRQAGMNPFAAVITLAILQKHEEEELANTDFSEYIEMADNDEGRKKVRSLSKFIEMGDDQRKALLGETVGYRVLKRVGDMVDQDWQCDWALDFEAS